MTGRTTNPFAAAMAAAPAAVQEALAWLEGYMAHSSVIDSPATLRSYLRLRLGHKPHEVFAVVFLDAQHRVIATQEMFRGTLTQTAVYPREVLIEALAVHAAAVVLAHNHPSGSGTPSRADEALTQRLKAALELVDIRVLDHLILTRREAYSFAEHGLL